MAFTSIISNWSVQPLIDHVGDCTERKLYIYIVLAIGTTCVDMSVFCMLRVLKEKLRCSFLVDLKQDLMKAILQRDFQTYYEKEQSFYVNLLTRDVDCISSQYFDSICGIYSVVVNTIITSIALVIINPGIYGFCILIGGGMSLLPKLFQKQLSVAQSKSSDCMERYLHRLKELLGGFTTIKLSRMQNRMLISIEKRNSDMENAVYKNAKFVQIVSWISMFGTSLSYVISIVIGVYMVKKQQLTVGELLVITQMIGGIIVPFEELPYYISSLSSSKIIQDKMKNVLGRAGESTEGLQNSKIKIWAKQNNDKQNNNKKMEYQENTYKKIYTQVNKSLKGELNQWKSDYLRLDQVTFGYEPEKPILKDIVFTFGKGKKYILVGESGSGKSTLVKLLLNIVRCDHGMVFLRERPIKEYPEEWFYQEVHYMEQEPFLFDDTIYENILLGRKESEKRVLEVLKQVGLYERVQHMEAGIYSRIEEQGRNLSVGEKQRIGIARAILSGARFLLFDEMTANIDPVLAMELEREIFALTDVTCLLITHQFHSSIMQKCDEILVLADGQIVEHGKLQELINLHGKFYAMYREACFQTKQLVYEK